MIRRWLAVTLGLLMVAAAAVQAEGPAALLAGAAAVAVLASLWLAAAGTVAVCAAVSIIAITDTAAGFAVLAGLAAAGFLLACHGSRTAAPIVTAPTLAGMFGLGVVAALAVSIPVQLRWVPLAAPLLVLAIFAVVLVPYLRPEQRR